MLIRSFNLLFYSIASRVPRTIDNHKWKVCVKVIFKICSIIGHYESHHSLSLNVFEDVIVKQNMCFHFIIGHAIDCKVMRCTFCYIYHFGLINFIQFLFTIVFVAINFKFNLFPKLSTNSSITFSSPRIIIFHMLFTFLPIFSASLLRLCGASGGGVEEFFALSLPTFFFQLHHLHVLLFSNSPIALFHFHLDLILPSTQQSVIKPLENNCMY